LRTKSTTTYVGITTMQSKSRNLERLAAGIRILVASSVLYGCATAHAPALSERDQTTLTEVQVYLDGLHAFRAHFTESGTDGESDGILWLDRPGRLRVEYVHPSGKLLLANHGRLLLADAVTGATTTMPVSRTPLDILLADKILLSGSITVTGVQRQADAFQIGLVKTDAPGQGRLTLQFRAGPLALYGVVVQDGAGRTNSFSLQDVSPAGDMDTYLFQYRPAG